MVVVVGVIRFSINFFFRAATDAGTNMAIRDCVDGHITVLDLTVFRQFRFFDASRDPFKVLQLKAIRILAAGAVAPRERP